MALALVTSFPWFIQQNSLSPAYLQAAKLLRLNASLQFLFSTVGGTLLLLPMQRWFPYKISKSAQRNFVAAHLDWYMLGFMQFCAAALICQDLPQQVVAGGGQDLVFACAQLLAFGGWVNPLSYFFRGLGINAFEMAGDKWQMGCAALGSCSATAILVGWTGLLWLVFKK
ncbi:hypothetical protein BASA81_003628 [Batrachochytrium salamandrivorans]|nr:hypothetical protein BASA81_003628 [Batrachochytrium salamandrivorans]